jgi:hypothetical protein
VEVLGDTTDGITTLDSEDDVRRRVVENLVHLVVTNSSVTVEMLTSACDFVTALVMVMVEID